jgi:hypothetical protein
VKNGNYSPLQMMTEIYVERIIFPNFTEKSYVDYSKIKVRNIRGKNVIQGSALVLHDATNEMEVADMIQIIKIRKMI